MPSSRVSQFFMAGSWLLALMLMAVAGLSLQSCHHLNSEPVTASVLITWVASGDDGLIGMCSQYEIKYATDSLTLKNNWTGAPRAALVPARKAAQVIESTMVTLELETGVPYYFAMKAADEVPNWSALSNIVARIIPDSTPPSAVAGMEVRFTAP